MKKIFSWIVLIAVIAVLIAVGIWIYRHFFAATTQIIYKTQTAEKGDLFSTISATGTLEPEELVNVGAQVGGMITSFGLDENNQEVNYRSQVKEGAVLAYIDDDLYQAEVNIAKASKQQAEAAIANAQATLLQSQASLDLATADWDRAQQLYPQGIMARSEYDSAKATFESAKASHAINQAKLFEAQAQLASAQASLEKCERNLGYCVITSPVDGVVIDRRVSIGQTVNASMSAPSLFLLAKDLKRMEVWVSVNEADIGSIKEGQKVIFTVDAYPGRTFDGTVQKIRLNATMSQNVVTYVVEIYTDNSDNLLLPYLTANVKFILDSRSGVLYVPNAALRFNPPMESGIHSDSIDLKENERLVWVLENGVPKPVSVVTGLNDGVNTEILSGGLQEGMQIITGSSIVTLANQSDNESQSATNPFLPQPPSRNKGPKK